MPKSAFAIVAVVSILTLGATAVPGYAQTGDPQEMVSVVGYTNWVEGNDSLNPVPTYADATKSIYIRVRNGLGASGADTFRFTGPSSVAAWTYAYYTWDPANPGAAGTDITSSVTGTNGWDSPTVLVGAYTYIRMAITPTAVCADADTTTVQIHVRSNIQTAKVDDCYVLVTRDVGVPDLMVEDPATPGTWVTDGTYENTATLQTVTQSCGTTSVTYAYRLQNDGLATSTFTLNRTGTPFGWTVTIEQFSGGTWTDVTEAVVGGTHTVNVDSGQYATYRITVQPGTGLLNGASTTIGLRARAMTNVAPPYNTDAAQGITTRRAMTVDALIKKESDPVGSYAASASQDCGADWVTYDIRIENTGQNPPAPTYMFSEQYDVSVSLSLPSWEARFLDDTSAIQASGWDTPEVSYGAYYYFKLQMRPTSAAIQDEVCTATVRVRSLASAAIGQYDDTVTGVTTRRAGGTYTRPDAQISSVDESNYIGDNIIEATATAAQTKEQDAAMNIATYWVLLKNNATATNPEYATFPEQFRVSAPAAPAGWTVTYLDWDPSVINPVSHEGEDITSSVVGGGWLGPILDPDETRLLCVRVQATTDAAVDDVADVPISVASAATALVVDQVKASTTRVGEQADGLIKRSVDATYDGGDVINDDGTNQTKLQSVSTDVKAVYHVQIENNSSTRPEVFNLTGPAGGSGWTVEYYSALTGGSNITTSVTGAGYRLPQLAAGASTYVRAEVTPDATVAGGATKDLLIFAQGVANANAGGNTANRDAVLARTRKAVDYQPDALIKNSGEAVGDYTGDSVYDVSGALAPKWQTVASNTTATYNVIVQNDGNVDDTFKITGPAPTPGWSLVYSYVDGPTVTDITAAVESTAGWVTPTALAPNETVEFRIDVTPDDTVAGDAVLEVVLRADSVANGGKRDGVLAKTTKLAVVAPDAAVRNAGDATYTGDGEINTTGLNQSVGNRVARDHAAVYDIEVQNDGNVTDWFIINCGAPSTGWTVKVFDALTGGSDKSSAALSTGGWATASAAAGSSVHFRVEVTPDQSVAAGAFQEILVTAKANKDPGQRDAVKVTTTKAFITPDGAIRNQGDADYDGDATYNTDGTNQSKGQIVDTKVAAVYEVLLSNDGDIADTFVVTGPTGGAGWTVAYYNPEMAGANEITSEVTGSGWTSPSVAVGGTHRLRIEVTPDATLLGNAQRDVLLTITSGSDDSHVDAVRATTTKLSRSLTDMLVANPDPDSFVGAGIFVAAGQNQTKTQTVATQVAAAYRLRIKNAGNFADTFRITGGASSVGWTVDYYDAVNGGTAITGAVTGGGLGVVTHRARRVPGYPG